MDSGDLSWMLMGTALVVFMVPGLALCYGGMVRSRNVLNMLMMNMYCIGAVPIVWVLVSYSLGNSHDGGDFVGGDWIGNLDQAVAIGSVVVFSFVVTFAIVKVIDLVIGLRVDEETEIVGLDQAIHAESAYNEGLKGSVVVLTPPLPSGR